MKKAYETLFAAVGIVCIVCMTIPAASAQTATITIDDLTVKPGANVTMSITVSNVTNMSGCDIGILYNVSVVNLVEIIEGDMMLLRWVIDNGTGWMHLNAINVTGLSDCVVVAYLNLTAVGRDGDTSQLDIAPDKLFDVRYDSINATVTNGTFAIENPPDTEPPLVTNVSASRDTILNDNGRPRAPGTNVTVLNVTVTDGDYGDRGVANVTINLSSIGGSPVQPMVRIGETDIWSVTTNAVNGINLTHQLVINATDNDGNYNDSVSAELTVLRRGDVCRDNVIDRNDLMRISGGIIGTDPNPTTLIGDVVGASGDPEGDGVVDLMDALYLARYGAGLEGEP